MRKNLSNNKFKTNKIMKYIKTNLIFKFKNIKLTNLNLKLKLNN